MSLGFTSAGTLISAVQGPHGRESAEIVSGRDRKFIKYQVKPDSLFVLHITLSLKRIRGKETNEDE